MRKINTRSFRLATRSTPREVNRQIVLNLIREHQPISRAELARRMNVQRAALTKIVRELVTAGDVEETGTAPAARGRRPTLLRVRTSGRLAVAVDVRPGWTSIALADFGGQVLSRDGFATPERPEALANELASRVNAVLRSHPSECQGIGIVVPGMVDRRTGRVLYAPRLGWRNAHVTDVIVDQTTLPVYVESAPIACALARLWSLTGKTRAVNNFAYVSISDGVGVGIVNRGEVLRGETQTAGELGHVSLDPNGPLCACGKRGCWEAFACNSATIARYTAAVAGYTGQASPQRARTSRPSAPTIEEIVRRAHVGENAAVDTLVETFLHRARHDIRAAIAAEVQGQSTRDGGVVDRVVLDGAMQRAVGGQPGHEAAANAVDRGHPLGGIVIVAEEEPRRELRQARRSLARRTCRAAPTAQLLPKAPWRCSRRPAQRVGPG